MVGAVLLAIVRLQQAHVAQRAAFLWLFPKMVCLRPVHEVRHPHEIALASVLHQCTEGVVRFQQEIPHPCRATVVAVALHSHTAVRVFRSGLDIAVGIFVRGIKKGKSVRPGVPLVQEVPDVVFLIGLAVGCNLPRIAGRIDRIDSCVLHDAVRNGPGDGFLAALEDGVVLYLVDKCGFYEDGWHVRSFQDTEAGALL